MVMEPVRHARRDTSVWPTVVGILIGAVVAVCIIGGLVGGAA